MKLFKNRTEREQITLEKMFVLYCREKRHSKMLCSECKSLLEYSLERIEKCPFGPKKPTCINCTVHCFQQKEKEELKEVMRFSGPKMIFRHPFLAIMHIFDSKINPVGPDNADKDIKKN